MLRQNLDQDALRRKECLMSSEAGVRTISDHREWRLGQVRHSVCDGTAWEAFEGIARMRSYYEEKRELDRAQCGA